MEHPPLPGGSEPVVLSTADIIDYCDALLAELALMLASLELTGHSEDAEAWTEARLGMPMPARQRPHRRVRPMPRRRR